MAGATMIVPAYCESVVTAASLQMFNRGARLEQTSSKLAKLHSAGLRGCLSKTTGGMPKTPLFTRRITLSSGFSSRTCAQALADVELQVPFSDVESPRKVIVIDNYDSFTYNLCQYLGDLGCDYEVIRNDEITIEELQKKKPRGILVSPGPGAPKDSGISLEVVLQLGSKVPIFGVCMGLQCMGEAFGGNIVRAPNGVVHGKTSPVYYDENEEDGLLQGLPNPFIACRYHSLVIDKETFPHDELEITAWTDDGLIMGIRHRKYRNLQAVQFHPESIITQDGKQIVANFLRILKVNDDREERSRLGHHLDQ